MELFLLKFDTVIGPVVMLHRNRNKAPLDPHIEQLLGNMLDLNTTDKYLELHETDIIFKCRIFTLSTQNSRGSQELGMLAVALDKAEQKLDVQELFEKMVQKFKYEWEQNDASELTELDRIQKLEGALDSLWETLCCQKDQLVVGKIMVLGLRAVGKTSILKRVSTGNFDENVRPTLGTQILKTVIEELRFLVYDMGGQKKLRNSWYTTLQSPDAIIFVLDLLEYSHQKEETLSEFQKIINHYYNKRRTSRWVRKTESINQKRKDPPLLILANKIDLLDQIPSNLPEFLDKYNLPTDILESLKWKIFPVSAKEGNGLKRSFKWLIESMI